MVVCTLVYLLRDGTVLLGMKKRGHGVGRWNGFGGKVHAGESPRDAAARELWEEAVVRVAPDALKEAGALHFTNTNPTRPDANMRVHVFRATVFAGDPQETDEMRPQWFAFADVPYPTMWPDDIHWLPKFLTGETIRGTFRFDGDTLIGYDVFAPRVATMPGR